MHCYFQRLFLTFAVVGLCGQLLAQDRLIELIDISSQQSQRRDALRAMNLARATVRWVGPHTFAMRGDDGWLSIDALSGERTLLDERPSFDRIVRSSHPNARRARPARGRQYTEEFSPDADWRAFYDGGNLFIEKAEGGDRIAVTTEGDASKRIKYGSASWVYGEELAQLDAMGWSPDGSKLWFYRFDDSMVKDYYLAMSQTKIQSTLDAEAFPMAGTENPICNIFVYDIASQKRSEMAVRPGSFNEEVGHYVYGISWSDDGTELLFHRTNRWQNIMEFCAADPESGEVRVIVREQWLDSWTDNTPVRSYLDRHADIENTPQYRGKMIWQSSRTGYLNYYLVDLSSGDTTSITDLDRDALTVVRIDLVKGEIFYMAAGPDNPYKLQLHKAKLDGSEDVLLTDPSFHHTINLSPDGTVFIDTAETAQIPPTITIQRVADDLSFDLAQSDISEAMKLGLRPTERVIFRAADGVTDLYGTLKFPINFDPLKKYPIIVQIYGGPESNAHVERFLPADNRTIYGFIVAEFAVRGNSGRGKKFLESGYLNQGTVEIDDHAAAIKAIGKLPYVDTSRVGIMGASYGGYASIMCMLRYPDLFHAAVASSSGVGGALYDTIYTERYMRTPQANPEGYKNGSAMEHAANLKGWLMLYYGTSDNNAHPSNTLSLIQALQKAGKYFEVQVGPDLGHTFMSMPRTMEFFVERLLITGPRG